MQALFFNCNSLKSLNLSNFKTKKATDISSMFSGCSSLQKKNIITNDKKILNNFGKK
jgi:surface protein